MLQPASRIPETEAILNAMAHVQWRPCLLDWAMMYDLRALSVSHDNFAKCFRGTVHEDLGQIMLYYSYAWVTSR